MNLLRAAGRLGLRIMDAAAGVLIVGLTLLTLCDVAGRNLMRQPVPGATELTELILALFVFLTFPRLAYSAGHIVVDLLDPLVGARLKRAQAAMSASLGALAFVVLVWPLARLSVRAFENGDTTVQLGIPLGHLLMVMAGLAALTAIAFLLGVATPPSRQETH